jgi:hypothetical protein
MTAVITKIGAFNQSVNQAILPDAIKVAEKVGWHVALPLRTLLC